MIFYIILVILLIINIGNFYYTFNYCSLSETRDRCLFLIVIDIVFVFGVLIGKYLV